MKLLVKSLQIAVFTSTLDLSNKIGFANQLIQDTKGLFDGDPIVLPIPSDAPPEIPRIILKNKNESYSLNVGLDRTDFFYNEREYKDNLPTKVLSDLEQDFLGKTDAIVRSIYNISSTRIIRLGFIVTFQSKVSKVDGKANSFVSEQYLKPKDSLKDPYDINIGVLKKIKVGKLYSNVWFRINPFRKKEDPLDNVVITVRLDINTQAEESLDLTNDEIRDYYKEASSYINKNLNSYIKE